MILYLMRAWLGQCGCRAVGGAGSRLGKRIVLTAWSIRIRSVALATSRVVREPRPTKLLKLRGKADEQELIPAEFGSSSLPFPEIVHQGEDLLPGFEHLGDPIIDRERELAF
jgi:hypothetical protein